MNTDNNIITTAPIEISELKKYFTDKTITYTIDYANSKLKTTKLLTYLSNLDLPCDILIDNDSEEFDELMACYMNASFIMNIPVLEKTAMAILFEYKGIFEGVRFFDFIDNNIEIVKHWASVLDSMVGYNIHIIANRTNDEDKLTKWVADLPRNDTDTTTGINFVNVFKYFDFGIYYATVNEEDVQFYESYFTENMFKGSNLFKYWANKENPLFLLTFGVAGKKFTQDEYIEERNQSIEEMKNASPI